MKLSFKFLNRWENSIFESTSDEGFAPVSAFVAGTILVSAFVMNITFFVIMAMYNGNEKSVIVAAAIIFGIALLIVAGKAFRNFRAFTSVGTKAGYTAYILALFVICGGLFTYLVAAFIMLYLLWIVIKAMLGGGKKKGRIVYDDGSSEEASVEKGLMGETYYKGKESGDEYMKY